MEEQTNMDEYRPEDPNSMEGYDKPVRNARIMLFVVAGIELISLVVVKNNTPEPEKTIAVSISILVALFFALFALWTKTKPYKAIIAALILYSSLLLISIIVSPISIFQGWVIKILVYVILLSSISNAKAVQKWKDSLKDKS
jgi:hypothetical protein